MLLDKSLEELVFHLWRIWRTHDHARCSSDALTFNELYYLEFIAKHKSVRLTDLANGLGITKASACAMVYKLEKRGLLDRDANDKDGRSIKLMISPEGEKLRENELVLYRRAATLLQDSMSEDDYHNLQLLLAKACRTLIDGQDSQSNE